jgi:hypothetical protein
MSERQRMTTRLKTLFQRPALFVLERIPIMLQHALHERRIWRHFGGQPSHELTDAAAKRIPETESTAKTPPFRTPWESRFNPNGNRSRPSKCRPLDSFGSEAAVSVLFRDRLVDSGPCQQIAHG